MIGGDAHITAQRHVQRAAKAVAVEHRDGGIGEVFYGSKPLLKRCFFCFIIDGHFMLGTNTGDGIDVVTGGESLVASAGQNHYPHFAVSRPISEDFAELAQ